MTAVSMATLGVASGGGIGLKLELWDIRLQGTSVVLRPLQADDAIPLARAAAENRQNYLYNPVPDGLEQARDSIERALRQRATGQRIPFALLRQDCVVGTTSFYEVHRVAFRTDERNRRSRNALERLGAQFEGIRRAHMPSVDGTVRNSAFYSILRSEWLGVSEHLQRLLSRSA